MARFLELAIARRVYFSLSARRACRVGSHSRWHCVNAPCCSAPHRFSSLVNGVPGRSTRILAICASAPISRSIVDNRATSHLRHPRDANEFLEVPGDELRSIVGNDPWVCFRMLLPSSLQNDFDFRFGHGFPQIPMDHRTTEGIQNGAQVVECAAHVDAGNVDMPMLARVGWLLEASSFARRFAFRAMR
jgi:hypothetical protein